MLGVAPLTKAIYKLRLTPATLTSLHGELCRLCLAARYFSSSSVVVSEFLATEYVDISEEAVNSDSRHLLLFFYYGGMILTALKDFKRALYFFEVTQWCQNLVAKSQIRLYYYASRLYF